MGSVTLIEEIKRLEEEGDLMRIVELLTKALAIQPDEPELFALRGHYLFRVEKYKEAACDASRAISYTATRDSYLLLGKAYFNLHQYTDAKSAFVKAKALQGPHQGFDEAAQWIDWCEEKLKKLSPGASTEAAHKKEETKTSAAPSVPMPTPKIKHDWYQNDTQVILTILVKNLKKEDVSISFHDTSISVTAKLPSGSDYSLELDLFHTIVPSDSTYKVLPSKVEVKMKKRDGMRWTSLESDEFVTSSKKPEDVIKLASHNYPSSSNKRVNWDKFEAAAVKEDEEEKPEGDAALNKLFQKIYADGSDEVRKAMNKSFMESGGTVLSTNWKDIAEKKIEVKPPDGMEFRKWN